jgi:molybdate/tungstate transport system substrate-binding protein
MAIAFRDNSRHARDITAENWHEILLRNDVSFGRSDPNADPCGYRTVLTMKLAEEYYEQPGLAERLLSKDRRFMRPKETDFLALLEVGAIDYVFIYRSVAEQHGLRWIALPGEINLKEMKFADRYASVSVEITGTEPGTWMTQRGEPMVYGLTIPRNAPNPEAALAFAAFILDKDKGMAIMERNGQPSVVPSPSETYHEIPSELKKYALEP